MLATHNKLISWCLFVCVVPSLLSCAHYRAAPLDLPTSLLNFNSGSLNDPQLQQRLAALQSLDSVRLGQWNRAQLLVIASERNPKVLMARTQLQVADAVKKTASALPNPSVSLGADYNLSQTAESPWLWSISTDWLLDMGLRRQLRMQSADTNIQAVRLEYAESLWSVRVELRTALLSYLMNSRRKQVLQEIQTYQEQLLQLHRQRITQGEGTAREALQVESELAHTRSTMADTARLASQAHAQLASALGVPVSALQSQGFIWDDLLQITAVNEQQLVQLREKALLSRVDLERAVLDYQSRELALQQSIREQYPQFSIGPGYSWDHGVKKVSLGISLTLPIFNRNQGPIAEALAARELAGQKVMLVQSTIQNEIDLAYQAYQESVQTLQQVVQQHNIAEQSLVQVQQMLAVGESEKIELMASQLLVTTQRLAVLDAIEQMQQSFGQLEDALRTPLSGPEVALNQRALLQVDSVH